MKLHESLSNWGGIVVEVVTDEELEDIDLAIKYHDHGDAFLYIRTYSGEEYKYGYWLNRERNFYGFDPKLNNGESDNRFIRRPIVFKNPNNVDFCNGVCWLFGDDRFGIFSEHGYHLVEKHLDADLRFDYVYNGLIALFEKYSNVVCHMTEYKNDLLSFVQVNNLQPLDEYKELINALSWDNSVRGYDGIAGKQEAFNYLYGDGVTKVLYRGKAFDVNKLTYKVDSRDEWGCATYCLNTKQFA